MIRVGVALFELTNKSLTLTRRGGCVAESARSLCCEIGIWGLRVPKLENSRNVSKINSKTNKKDILYGCIICRNEQLIHSPRQEHVHRLPGGLKSFWGHLKWVEIEGKRSGDGGVGSPASLVL